MINVFKDFLNQEFGKSRYERYFTSVKTSLDDKSYYARKKGSEELYSELFCELQKEDDIALKEKLEHLVEAMYLAVRIHRQYLFISIFYVLSGILLIGLELEGIVTLLSLFAISLCFLYKTYEFVVNKYCYVDANIILVYKSVLDRLLAQRKVKV